MDKSNDLMKILILKDCKMGDMLSQLNDLKKQLSSQVSIANELCNCIDDLQISKSNYECKLAETVESMRKCEMEMKFYKEKCGSLEMRLEECEMRYETDSFATDEKIKGLEDEIVLLKEELEYKIEKKTREVPEKRRRTMKPQEESEEEFSSETEKRTRKNIKIKKSYIKLRNEVEESNAECQSEEILQDRYQNKSKTARLKSQYLQYKSRSLSGQKNELKVEIENIVKGVDENRLIVENLLLQIRAENPTSTVAPNSTHQYVRNPDYRKQKGVSLSSLGVIKRHYALASAEDRPKKRARIFEFSENCYKKSNISNTSMDEDLPSPGRYVRHPDYSYKQAHKIDRCDSDDFETYEDEEDFLEEEGLDVMSNSNVKSAKWSGKECENAPVVRDLTKYLAFLRYFLCPETNENDLLGTDDWPDYNDLSEEEQINLLFMSAAHLS